ncbi:unnamed protein product [Sphagnum troendelagicum]
MVLLLTMTNKERFDDEREMNVDDTLHGWTKDENWWVRMMTWRRCRWDHRMTWTLKAWGPTVRLVLDVEGMKVGQVMGQ